MVNVVVDALDRELFPFIVPEQIELFGEVVVHHDRFRYERFLST